MHVKNQHDILVPESKETYQFQRITRMNMKHILLLSLFAHAMITAADEQEQAIVKRYPLDLDSPELVATFNALQEMHRIVRRKERNGTRIGRYQIPEPSYGINQTEQGLYLHINDRTHQIYAATPWGRSEIVDESYFWGHRTEPETGIRLLFSALRDSFTLSFVKNSDENASAFQFYVDECNEECVGSDKECDHFQSFPLSELKKYKNTDTKILAPGISAYAVLADKEKSLPQPKMFGRDTEDCKASWNGLMQQNLKK